MTDPANAEIIAGMKTALERWNAPVSGTDAVEVTQADIDAAKRHFQLSPTHFFEEDRLAAAFARHRIQSLSTRTEELVKARIEWATGQYHDANRWGSVEAPDGDGNVLDWICRAASHRDEQS